MISMAAAPSSCCVTAPPRLGLLRRRLSAKRLGKPVAVAIVLLARRPCEVSGQNSIWELCPYLIEVASAADLIDDSQAAVRLLMHRDEISSDLLRRSSGLRHVPVRGWTLVGCGSVGSKIAVQWLVKGGDRPSSPIAPSCSPITTPDMPCCHSIARKGFWTSRKPLSSLRG